MTMGDRPDPVEIGLQYLAVGHHLRKVVDASMTAGGLSLARAKVLEVLVRRSPLQQSELPDALGHAPRSVTQSAEALERDGLVERTASSEDRRSKLVTLTPQGAKALAAGTAAGEDVRRRIFGPLGGDHLAQLARLLHAPPTPIPAPPTLPPAPPQ